MKQRPFPPRLFVRFFRWFCHPRLHRYIEGDLVEVYGKRIAQSGKLRADLLFIIDVLLLFRPGIVRPFTPGYNLNAYAMYKNYLKTGWRNLARSKGFSLINISGLALGLTCSVLIALWVADEYAIDNFHQHGDRLFVMTSAEFSGTEINGTYDTPGILAEEMKKILPEVEYASHFAWTSWNTFAVGEKRIKQPGNFASPDFFKMFSYPLLMGSKENVLNAPESIVISRRMARRLFGNVEAAMDQIVRFENYRDLKVTGVFEDLGDNVSERFEYIATWEFFLERNPWAKNWNNSGPTTFLMLKEGTDTHAFETKIRHFLKTYVDAYSELDRLELGIQKYGDRYLNSNFSNGYVDGGRIAYVRVFQVIAVFILLIACINFMNLSTARAVKRAKEIGIRKVVGAFKGSLVTQFMLEAFLFTLGAIAIAVILIQLVLPEFNLLTRKNIPSPISNLDFWKWIGILTIATAAIAGSYPAFLLSSFKPVGILKGTFRQTSGSGTFRKALVIFQFTLSVIFIVGVIVVSSQIDFIQNKNLGYQKENLIYVPLSGALATQYESFKLQSLQQPGVLSVSKISQRPVQIENTTGSVEWEGKPSNIRPTFTQVAIGYDFAKTMKATLVEGRDFSEHHTDSASYVINETALKVIGYHDPIGKPLTLWNVKGTIVGVMKDFHFNSLHVPIEPLVMRLGRGPMQGGAALIRIEPGMTTQALEALEAIHQKINPEFPFAHQFADEEYSYLYQSEMVIKDLSTYFAALAIAISCLGLLGLVVFNTEQRTKEVGIRKVLGATLPSIVFLISKDYLRLVLIAILLSIPVAYYALEQWLDGFQYHVAIQWWMFGLAATCAIAITLFTISFQSIRAALANPVKSLKYE